MSVTDVSVVIGQPGIGKSTIVDVLHRLRSLTKIRVFDMDEVGYFDKRTKKFVVPSGLLKIWQQIAVRSGTKVILFGVMDDVYPFVKVAKSMNINVFLLGNANIVYGRQRIRHEVEGRPKDWKWSYEKIVQNLLHLDGITENLIEVDGDLHKDVRTVLEDVCSVKVDRIPNITHRRAVKGISLAVLFINKQKEIGLVKEGSFWDLPKIDITTIFQRSLVANNIRYFQNPENNQARWVFKLSDSSFLVFKKFDEQGERFTYKVWKGDMDQVSKYWKTNQEIELGTKAAEKLIIRSKQILNEFHHFDHTFLADSLAQSFGLKAMDIIRKESVPISNTLYHLQLVECDVERKAGGLQFMSVPPEKDLGDVAFYLLNRMSYF